MSENKKTPLAAAEQGVTLGEALDTTRELPEVSRIINAMESRFVGQDRVLAHLRRMLRLFYSGLKDPERPIGAFLFAGPSGAGKTYAAELFARVFLGADDDDPPPLTRIECSSLSERHQITRLIGGVAELVGYDDEPLLAQISLDTPHYQIKAREKWPKFKQSMDKQKLDEDAKKRAIRNFYDMNKPYLSVVLLDEIEKAHPQVFKLLLHILDKGQCQMRNVSFGATSFVNTVFCMTTNIGSEEIQQELREVRGETSRVGFNLAGSFDRSAAGADEIESRLFHRALKAMENDYERFSGPFLGRIRDNIVVYRPLSEDNRRTIINLELKKIQTRILSGKAAAPPFAFPRVKIEVTPLFVDFLMSKGTNSAYGARPLKQALDKHALEPLALVAGELNDDDELVLDVKDGKTVIYFKRRAAQVAALLPEVDIDGDSWTDFLDDDGKSAVPVPPGYVKKTK